MNDAVLGLWPVGSGRGGDSRKTLEKSGNVWRMRRGLRPGGNRRGDEEGREGEDEEEGCGKETRPFLKSMVTEFALKKSAPRIG